MHVKMTPSVVICQVASEQELFEAELLANCNNISTKMFYEPDLGSIATAFATEVVSSSQRRLFRNYPLWESSFNSFYDRGPPDTFQKAF